MESISNRDLQVITQQLGRRPVGVVGIARRCLHGYPQVIINAPVRMKQRNGQVEPEIFPTVYWLTCPKLVAAVSQLEGEGMICRIQAKIDSNPELKQQLEAAHARTAKTRMQMVTDGSWAKAYPSQWKVLEEAGVGGIRGQGIKCLHTHYADYLATGDNPVGEIVHRELEKRDLLAEIECTICGDKPGCGLSEHNAKNHGDKHKIAVAKVGTNSVRMLVVECQENGENPESPFALSVKDDVSQVTRIGRGVDQARQLSREGIQATIEVLADWMGRAEAQGARIVRLVGTSALRDAAKGQGEQSTFGFAALLRERTGLELEIISGEKEAQLSYRGAIYGALGIDPLAKGGADTSDGSNATKVRPAAFARSAVVIDIGGGSTEVMDGRGYAQSFDIGAVRLAEIWLDQGGKLVGNAVHWEKLISFAKGLLGIMPSSTENPSLAVGVGGTFTSLAALWRGITEYVRQSLNGTRLTRDSIYNIGQSLFATEILQRKEIAGMQPGREDILPFGAAIAVAVMDALGLDSLVVSVDDMLLGMALEWYTTRCGYDR